MTTLTALQVADYWIKAGGPKRRAVEWVAIALGESGYRTDVVSSAGAIGLWQIMPFNAAPHGTTPQGLYDPLINARVAVEMSGGGTNCAAWDSCYADIQASGRLSYLAWPQPGSADYANLTVVSAELGHDKLGGAVPPPGTFPTPELVRASASIDRQLQALQAALVPQLVWIRQASDSIARPGVLPWVYSGR